MNDDGKTKLIGKRVLWGIIPREARQKIDTGGLPVRLIFEKDQIALADVYQKDGTITTHRIDVTQANTHPGQPEGIWVLGVKIRERHGDRLDGLLLDLAKLNDKGFLISLVFGISAEQVGPLAPGEAYWSVDLIGPNLKSLERPIAARTLEEAVQVAQHIAGQISGEINFSAEYAEQEKRKGKQ